MSNGATRSAKYKIAAAAVVFALGLSACGNEEVAEGTEESTVDRLGIVLYTSNPWNREYGEAFEAAAERLGVEEVSVLNAEADPQQQLSQVQTLLNQGYEGVAINLVGGLSTAQLNSLFEENDAYYTTVFELTQWHTTYDSDHYINYISPNYPGSAEAVLDELAEVLPDGGEVVAIGGSASLSATLSNQAWVGFEAGLENNPQFELVGNLETDYTAEGGQEKAADLLASNPEAVALLSTDGASAEGAVAAIRAAGLTPGEDIYVVVADDAGTVPDLVENGSVLAAAALPAALVANYHAALLFDQLNGVDADPALEQLWLEMPVITSENIEAYLERYAQDPGDQFITERFSRFLSPEDWDPQGQFSPVTELSDLWPGVERPSDFEEPDQFIELNESGAFDEAAQELQDRYQIDAFSPLPE